MNVPLTERPVIRCRFRVRARSACWIFAALAFLPGCAVHGLSFKQDDRIAFTSPDGNETVNLPFEVSWTATDYDGRFVLFFDRAPMARNKPLISIVPDHDPCRLEVSCPDDEWLNRRNVYVTAETSVLIETLPDLRDSDHQKDRHEMYLVLLDAEGRRVGEATWVREFVVRRD